MKALVLQESLEKALSITSRFSGGKVSLPVLANTLIKAKANKLTLMATDLEISTAITLGAKIEKDGVITVPSKTIYDLVSSAKSGQLVLDVKGEKLEVSSDDFKSVILGMNASDFPEIPDKLPKESFSFDSKDIKDALSKVLFSVSVDETRPVLTGVLMIIKTGQVEFVSTDGYRLSRFIIKDKNLSLKEEIKVIVPKNALLENLTLSATVDKVNLAINNQDNQVMFEVGEVIIGSRIIQGEFPDFEKIIPKEGKIKISLDKQDFARTVKLSSIFARDAGNVLKLNIEESRVVVSSESSQSGSQEGKLDAKIDGVGKNGLKIAFNYKYLEDFTNCVEGENIEVRLTDANAPGVFLDIKENNYLHIIMPVKISS